MTSKVRIDFEAHGTTLVKREIDGVGNAAEDAGEDFQSMARDAGFLDKRVGELRGELKGLFAEFNKSGDLDLLKKINAGNRDLGRFTRLQKQFADMFLDVGKEAVQVGAKAGVEFGGSILGNAAKTLANSKALLIGGLVGLGATLSPFLGGVIGSAILGGTGIGGIIGGVALAAKDPRVQDAAQSLGSELSKAFQEAGTPFIAPTIKVLEELRPIGVTIAGDLREAFASVAPVFLPLAHGITDLVQTAMPGLTEAMEASKPVIRAIAQELPHIGHALSTFFSDIGDHSDEAVMAFITLSKVIQTIITHSGRLIAGLAELFEITVRTADKIAPIIEKIYGWIPIIGDFWKEQRKDLDDIIGGLDAAKDSSGDFAGSLDDVKDSATEAKNKLVALNDALSNFFDIAMNSSQATIAYERAWDEMVESLSEGKKTLDLTTEAGRKHRESIDSTISGIQKMHEARVKEGMVVTDSLAIRDRELEKMRAQLIQLGYNKQQIDDIINLYKLMPDLASTTVEAPGAETTIAQLREMLALVNALKGGIAIGALGGVKVGGKRAAGGPVLSGQTYLVGEQGPELLTMGSASGNVTNAVKTAAAMSGASGGASRPQVSITYVPSGNAAMDAFIQAIWPSFLKQVRIDGGDLSVFGAA